MDTVYCYPKTDCLINKLNIHDNDRLLKAEISFTSFRLAELLEMPIVNKFDFNYLKNIHFYIFQDLYDWAGKIRVVDIAKSNMFCKCEFIDSNAQIIFKNLSKDVDLRYKSRTTVVEKLAYHFSEINALHPFREGNGRTQREFFRQIAFQNGYRLDFSNCSREEMTEASKDSFVCNYEKMENVFSKCLF